MKSPNDLNKREALELLEKIDSKQELTLEDTVLLYNHLPVAALLSAANDIRFKINPKRAVSWQIDRNINYTNLCISGCKFCNFHLPLSKREKSYILTLDEYRKKIDELFSLGGDQILLQGGLHPQLRIEYFEDLFTTLKREYPNLKLNALGPPEVAHIARISKITVKETLQRLISAGLDSLPGAGAEILSERVRKVLSPGKPSAQSWIEVMEEAHRLHLGTTATMVYGGIETIPERLQHLHTLKAIQERREPGAPGFRAFIAWPMQIKGTKLEGVLKERAISPIEHLKMVAISRIVLTNIPHIQVSWLTIGKELAKVALHSGADDMGSIMIEENVVSSAGARFKSNREEMIETIKEAGFEWWLRNQDYTPYTPHLPTDLH
ncbi:MAG: CofH family radical SAM protein [Bacteroidales bacterium]